MIRFLQTEPIFLKKNQTTHACEFDSFTNESFTTEIQRTHTCEFECFTATECSNRSRNCYFACSFGIIIFDVDLCCYEIIPFVNSDHVWLFEWCGRQN